MKRLKQTLLSFATLSLLSSSIAYADEAVIRQSLNKSMPSLKIQSLKPSEIQGLYEVTVDNSIVYVSEDGKYLLQGHLIDIANRKDLTEGKLSVSRKEAIDKLGKENMIIFTPKESKYTVSIFTDIDCGYCRKLHSEMDQYMAEGITIQYLFYPRAGKGSESYNKAVSVWCADDKHAALTASKSGQTLELKTCVNPIDEHMQLGIDFEARGTPMIVTAKGNVFPGYLPAKKLRKALDDE